MLFDRNSVTTSTVVIVLESFDFHVVIDSIAVPTPINMFSRTEVVDLQM